MSANQVAFLLVVPPSDLYNTKRQPRFGTVPNSSTFLFFIFI